MADARPNLMRRRLGLALRTLRQRSGLNLPDAVRLLGLSGSSALSKIENGKQRVPAATLDKYFQAYEVHDEQRILEIRQLAAQASSSRRTNLFDQYRDAVRDPFADYLELEELAAHADWYAAQLIPGLLQTPEYAYAVIEGSGKWNTAREVRTFVELRMKRQQVLRRDRPLSMWCVLDEAALRRAMGGKQVLAGQLQHLLDVSDELPGVEIQVLPFDVGVHTGIDGTFTLFRFDAGDPLTVLEPLTSSLYLEEDEHVGRYEVAFNHLRARALDIPASRGFIKSLIEEES
ncbi:MULTISPECIES: helix-turn-helix domain-containing protein [unclassified Streptomyces]|uniref:helix-turn-helix domain-containing protein n=1 Tax=unclassified Streptomyces TaxID=2593676 RepID=UPI0038050A6D